MEARKTRIGKMVSTLMALVLTFMFVLTPIETNAQTTRGALCTNCGIDQLVPHTTYSPWSNPAKNPCVHRYNYGMDWTYVRTKTITYKCPNCGEATVNRFTEYKTECHGYN